jgi:hypothetical protein
MVNIIIKKNDKPHLETCKMICDGGLNPKLNNYELTKFLNSHETNLFIGKPASGKTSLIYSFFRSPKLLKKVFHNIYLFQPEASRSSMSNNIFSKIPEEQIYNELTYENLNNVMNTIKNEDNNFNNCIIFDDMTAYLKDGDIVRLLKELIFNRRHLRTSIFFLVQTYLSIPKDIRKMFSNLFIFKIGKEEQKVIADEIININKKYIDDIFKMVFTEKYKFLFINVNEQRFFDGFDELLIEE